MCICQPNLSNYYYFGIFLAQNLSSDYWSLISLNIVSYFSDNIVAHYMLPEIRERMDIEMLWCVGVKYDDKMEDILGSN